MPHGDDWLMLRRLKTDGPDTSIRSKVYSRNEWSILADVKIRIWKGLKFDIRYHTISPIRKRFLCRTPKQETRKQYNNVITCRLIYVFNEKFQKNDKGKWEKTLRVRSKILLCYLFIIKKKSKIEKVFEI